MKVVSTLGIMMLVIGFLASALGAFPLADLSANSTEITEETPFSKDLVEETAGKVGTLYTTIIDDLAGFASNPDLALAQSRRDQMSAYATDLAGQFQLFADDLQARLDDVTTEPTVPSNLVAAAGSGQIGIDWADNPEADIDFYNVYRSTTPGGPYEWYGAVSTSAAIDSAVTAGLTYYYTVTAVNTSNAESTASNEVSATALP